MAVIATGFFDGVHLGHRLVIDTLVAEAARRGEDAIVVTFWPHPRMVLQKDARDLRILSTPEEKRGRLLEAGAKDVMVIPFDRDFASLEADQYLKYLMLEYGASCVVLGYDTRFGSDQLETGRIAQKAFTAGIDAVVAPEFRIADGLAVSSTRIRSALLSGDVCGAAEMLGYRYSFSGVVVGGRQLGRTIGFPTANTKLCNPLKLVPANGVYATEVEVCGERLRGMTNIGDDGRIETHIFDFDRQIYGLEIRVSFVARLRDEMRFGSLEELKSQLLIDQAACRNLLV